MSLFGTLGAWLGYAKARGRKDRDVAEFREVVMTACRGRPGVDEVAPDPSDCAKFQVSRGGQSSSADVTNLFGYISAYPQEDADDLIARFVNAFTEDSESAINDAAIVPVIRRRDYVEEAARTGLSILSEPAGADLMVVYMADSTDSMSAIRVQDVPERSLAEVRTLALSNLRNWLPNVVADAGWGEGVLYYVEGNTMLSTGLVALDEFWRSINPRFQGDVLIALPRRDQLFIFDDDGSERTRVLARRLIEATYKENFNLLSPLLYARRNGHLVPVTD